MTGMTTATAKNLLQYVTGYASMPPLPSPGNVWLALFTGVGTDAGPGFTEVSGNGYARVSILGATAMNAAVTAIPATISNLQNLSFPTATPAAWTGIIAWGLYDAVTSGNLLYWDFLGADPWFPCTIGTQTPSVITAIGITAGSSPGLANLDYVVFTAEYGGALPAILTQYTAYQVANLTADTFNVSQNAAATSACMVRKITTATIGIGLAATFTGDTPGSLVLTAA
jgi:hypothetical protein